jgi:hypothetical protein
VVVTFLWILRDWNADKGISTRHAWCCFALQFKLFRTCRTNPFLPSLVLFLNTRFQPFSFQYPTTMTNIYYALAIIVLFLCTRGAFRIIITTSVQPALDCETHNGPFIEVTRRNLRYQKGPINFNIGSFYRRRPTSYGLLHYEGNESALSTSTRNRV